MSHPYNRQIVAQDMANRLVAETRERMPRHSYRSVVDHAVRFASSMSDEQWRALGQQTGHCSTGKAPDPETIAKAKAQLRALCFDLPTSTVDPFAGLGTQ